MTRRNTFAIILLVIIAGAAGAVAYVRFGPKPAPTGITIINHAAQVMSVALTLPDGRSSRQTLAAGASFEAPFSANTRMDVHFGSFEQTWAGAWVVDDIGGVVEITVNGEELEIAGAGLKIHPVSE